MSGNLLNSNQIECKVSDTQSEVSESGTGTSISGRTSWGDSREELRDLVAVLGLQEVSDLHQDRFRVDRKKLELMLLGENEELEIAEKFFCKIMEETNTFISWPSRLKIGAKTKKDPHVRIAGRPEDVRVAKEKIMTVLDTRSNRVTMKLDVSYTDHSHIIGKGGLSIKRVMEETQCHIHFPDSNRLNPVEKSNQVSIAGDIEGVEKARSRVRNLTPLIFCFELPIMGLAHHAPDLSAPYVLHIQNTHNVQVMFRTRPKLHATLVLVKGVEWEVQQVKHATLLLIDYMCDSLANQILVQMSMEISPQHHSVVLGKGSINLKGIMKRTQTQIMFPDASDPNVPTIKKSNVTIIGTIHNVYLARQQLMGSLPLVLMFDLPEQTKSLAIDPEKVSQVMSSLDVFINIRHKPKQNNLSVIIKGIERNASNIYEARNRLLNISEARVVADIPATYLIPANPTFNDSCALAPSPISSPVPSPVWQYSSQPYNHTYVPMVPQQHFVRNMLHGSMGSSGYYSSFGQYSNSSDQSQECNISNGTSSSATSPIASPQGATQNNTNSEQIDMASALCDNRKAPGFEKHLKEPFSSMEYEMKRIAGLRAMQTNATGYRTPTNIWSGYGICHTSPASLNADRSSDTESDIWKTPTNNQQRSPYSVVVSDLGAPSTSGLTNLNTSNYMDHTPTRILNRITSCTWPDLVSLLTSFGLEKYIGLFRSHEIDLTTFQSLTDKDLVEIGVTAFGARRKMLLVISELNKRSRPFSGSAAPGAERKSSSSTLTSNSSSPHDGW